MSYANGRKIRRARLRKVGRLVGVVQGCTCEPDIKVGTARGAVDGAITLRHDDWCPLFHAGRTWVAFHPGEFGGCSR